MFSKIKKIVKMDDLISLQDEKVVHYTKAPIYSPFLKLRHSDSIEAIKSFKLVNSCIFSSFFILF